MRANKIRAKVDPYPQCKDCKTISDCPHPDVAIDGMGSPLAPDICNKPWEINHNTFDKTHYHARNSD